MKVSLNWVKRYVDLPEDLTTDQIAFDLTMRTVEVEEVIHTAEKFNNIVVGQIKEIKEHPNADALKICITDCGEDEPKQIVCGGSNLYEGEKVVVCKPGAVVVWHGEGDPVEIKESKLRGEKSYGMICASSEVYLGDFFPEEDERKIMDLSEIESIDADSLVPGTNIADALGLGDTVLDIDNKSLTNRPDLWGHYGIARELSAIYDVPLKDIGDVNEGGSDKEPDLGNVQELLDSLPEYKVTVEEPDKCMRYDAVQIEGVYQKEAPLWMQTAVTNGGMRPINAIVDISNYVMLATGQPTHAFDKTHVTGDHIIVRNAHKGEKLLLLNNDDLDLTEDDLVICDVEDPMGLAGIRGGKKDSILPETTSVVLEVADFSAGTIRSTEKRFDEKTDAGIRYEKGIDTERTDQGLAMALKLFKEIFPECKFTAFGEVYSHKTQKSEIDVTQDFLDRRIGTKLGEDKILHILDKLGYEVEVHETGGAAVDKGIEKDEHGQVLNEKYYHVIAPTWRSTGDVYLRDDILGDIVRLIGYENFDSKPFPVNFESAVKQPYEEMERRIKEYLAFRCDYYEVFTYPWVSDKYIKAANIDTRNSVRLATPPAPDQANLRSSLVPGLLEAVEKNLRYYNDFKIFEMAEVFEKGEYHESTPDETLPVQKMMLTGVNVAENAKMIFFEAKGVVEYMARFCHMDALGFTHKIRPAWADSESYLNITCDGEIIGNLGLVAVKTLTELGIDNAQVAMFEIEMDKLKPFPSRTNVFKPLPVYPLVEEDLSILVDEDMTWSKIYDAIHYMCREVRFNEIYRGKQVPEGKKSVTLTVLIGSDKGTMNSKQIDKKMKSIIGALKKKCGAELRD